MPAPFKKVTREQFAVLLERFHFTRRINAVHMHHTWKPRRRDFRGHETIVAMWRHHTEVNKWSDIAQHITIDPNGDIWLGRNWNLPPASASGHNGNRNVGPFMFEMIGDFDEGHDPFDGEQRETALEVIVRVQKRFNLKPDTLQFHRFMSSKSCPGSGISYEQVLDEVRNRHAQLTRNLEAVQIEEGHPRPFGEHCIEGDAGVNEALEVLNREVPRDIDSSEAEEDHEETYSGLRALGDRDRGLGLSPEQLDRLRPHLVNLNMGAFSRDGTFKTSQEDVDAIFEDHLVEALDDAERKGGKLRIVFFAHGGLVKESAGLAIAQKHIDWWRKNHIYPIYFIWETGLFETVGQLLRRGRERVRTAFARDLWDYTTDPLIEQTVRALQGPRIWGGMKLSAKLASAKGGGAHYVAGKLKAFCEEHRDRNTNSRSSVLDRHEHGDRVELHAVGHSAGSIFHAHFIPAALGLGVPAFKTVHFLAPALRVDEFCDRIKQLMGGGIEQLSVFTMRKDFERADNCAAIYRKSLLYLIHHALEPAPEAPILGLEICLRENPELRQAFGLGAQASTCGEVIWSVSPLDSGRSASKSRSHGGFDDDPATMNSLARRILGKEDAEKIEEYVSDGSRALGEDPWSDDVDWPETLQNIVSVQPVAATVFQPLPPISPQPFALGTTQVGPGGRRRALCIGINAYPTAPLNGCVRDAEAWAKTLRRLGFESPNMLLNQQATRSKIIQHLQELIRSSASGDVIVFQFAGHGTQLPDLNGDEAPGDTPGQDEALCPYDFSDGGFLLDDDVGEIFSTIPPGVNLTCFIDCCHSGTITRFAVGAASGRRARGTDERRRFIQATPEMTAAHERFRRGMGLSRSFGSGGSSSMREIVFSACRSDEVAWESGEHGEFTLKATQLLESGLGAVSNEEFKKRVTEAFGPAPRQHVQLDCPPGMDSRILLQPLV